MMFMGILCFRGNKERSKKMSSKILGKWVAIGAPHKIEFFIGDKCEMYSPADGEIISGTYSVSGNKIIAIIDGDTKITFESLPNNTIQMLPPAGRALPPLPFMRA